MTWELIILDISLWFLGILFLFFPIDVLKITFIGAKWASKKNTTIFDEVAKDYLRILYTDPGSLNLKFPGSTAKVRIGGLIFIASAIAIIYKMFNEGLIHL